MNMQQEPAAGTGQQEPAAVAVSIKTGSTCQALLCPEHSTMPGLLIWDKLSCALF